MKKSEIFQKVLSVVSDCIEIDTDTICSNSRTDDAVIARCLVAVYCNEYGLLHKHIQKYLHLRSHSSVRYYLQMYKERKETNKHFRCIASFVGHELDTAMQSVGR